MAQKKRTLVIWDAMTFPYTVGDIIGLNHFSLCLQQMHGTEFVDVAFVCDPKNPCRKEDPMYGKNINSYNYHYHLNSLIPLAQINQSFGSLFVFNSYDQLEKFVSDNIHQYEVWPSGMEYANSAFSYRRISRELVQNFYKANGYLPELKCKPVMNDWAMAFYRNKVLPRIPVTVSIRINNRKDAVGSNANTNVDAWIEFFKFCHSRYPVTFVTICSLDEVDERLFSLPNVIVPKRYFTSPEQDMALISASPLHIGTGGGSWMMVLQSQKPYILIMETTKDDQWFRTWANANQVYVPKIQTPELLITEFDRLFKRLDFSKWMENCRNSPTPEITPFLLGMGQMNTQREPYPLLNENFNEDNGGINESL